VDAVGVEQTGQIGAGLGDGMVALEAVRADQWGQVGHRLHGGVDAGGLAEPGEQPGGAAGRDEHVNELAVLVNGSVDVAP